MNINDYYTAIGAQGIETQLKKQVKKQTKKPTKSEGIIEKFNLLPLLGSVLGAGAGGLASSPSVFGIPAGIIAGGAAGAGAGEALEQVLTKKFNPKGLVAETTLGGASPYIGKGLNAVLKPVTKPLTEVAKKAVSGASKITGLAPDELYQQVFRFKPSTLESSKRRGIDIIKELRDEKIKPGENISEQLSTSLNKWGTQLKGLLENSTKKGVTIPTNEITSLFTPIKSKLSSAAIPGKGSTLQQIDELVKSIKTLGPKISPLEAQQQKEALDEFIHFNIKDPNLKEQILQIARGGYKKAIEGAIGGDKVKTINTRLSALIEASRRISETEGLPRSLGIREMMGIPSATAFGAFLGGPTGGAITGGAAMLNSLLRLNPDLALKTANVLGNKPQIPQQLTKMLSGGGLEGLGQAGVRGLQSLINPQQDQSVDQTNYEDGTNYQQQENMSPMDNVPQQVNPYPVENFISDIQRDPNNFDMYKYIFEQYQQVYGQQKQKPQRKTESQLAREESAFLVDDALSQFEKGSIITGPGVSQFQDFLAKFNFGDAETVSFNETISAIKASIAKARSGTSFTPNEEKLLNKYTPNVGDSKQQIKTKLNNLKKIFSRNQNTQVVPNQQQDIYSLLGMQ